MFSSDTKTDDAHVKIIADQQAIALGSEYKFDWAIDLSVLGEANKMYLYTAATTEKQDIVCIIPFNYKDKYYNVMYYMTSKAADGAAEDLMNFLLSISSN